MKPTDTNLAKFYGLNRGTIAKYRKGTTVEDKRRYVALLEYFIKIHM